jgi:hypothetical protein
MWREVHTSEAEVKAVTELLPGFRAHYEGYDWAQEVLQKHATGKLSDNSITVVV